MNPRIRTSQLLDPGDADTPSPWRIRLWAIIWFTLFMGFLLSAPILADWAPWVLALVAAVAAVLALPIVWVQRRLFARNRRRTFLARWLRSTVAMSFLLAIVAAAPIYYLATIPEVRPALVPQVTLTNGRKSVVLQGMFHVGSENFYRAVIYDVEKAFADGYILYYESVQKKSPESQAFFRQLTTALTGSDTDLSSTYRAMGEACGLKFQADYFKLLEADMAEHPERHVIADVDAIEMKREYERLMREDSAFALEHADDFSDSGQREQVGDGLARAVQWLKRGTEGQRKLAGFVCRGFMSRKLASNAEDEPGKFDAIVLHYRNRELARRIVEDSHEKIFVTYGANHLSGVINMLREQAPSWRVASVKWMRTIEAPKHFEAKHGLNRDSDT